MFFRQIIKLWIWISALASVAGWLLSASGQLNQIGYAIFAVVAILIVWIRKQSWSSSRILFPNWKQLQRRFRRPLPFAFAILTTLVFIGAILYPPTNHAALSYRFSRVLQWLAHEHWFWIHTLNVRMNTRACGMEWMTAPFLLFTKSDRAVFLLNFIPFLLLPGLIFSVWTRLGVCARVAWQWMWLLPTGYCFLLQAGSAGNDAFPTVYGLAAIDFGCRAWASRRASDLSYSILAAALLVGAKASNLPLLLPWAILVSGPLLRLTQLRDQETDALRSTAARREGSIASNRSFRWFGSVAEWSLVALVAAIASFLPNAILNQIHAGDWTAANIEGERMTVQNPIIGIVGNAFQLLRDNLAPPIFPQAAWWNQNSTSILPEHLRAILESNFHGGFLWLHELPTEDWAGLGFGLSVLLILATIASWRDREQPKASLPGVALEIPSALRYGVLVAAWLALLGFCSKSAMEDAARLISPYYPLVFPLLLIGPAQSEVVRRGWWHIAAWCVILVSFLVLMLTPARPLWPANTVLSKLADWKPQQQFFARAAKVYAVYAGRSDPLAHVRELLPPQIRTIGFMGTGDDLDISLWRPYGTKRVEHILVSDSRDEIVRRGIHYAVLGGYNFRLQGITFEDWLEKTKAKTLATTTAVLKVREGVQPWYIVHLNE